MLGFGDGDLYIPLWDPQYCSMGEKGASSFFFSGPGVGGCVICVHVSRIRMTHVGFEEPSGVMGLFLTVHTFPAGL